MRQALARPIAAAQTQQAPMQRAPSVSVPMAAPLPKGRSVATRVPT
jgi:hypothetical protein